MSKTTSKIHWRPKTKSQVVGTYTKTARETRESIFTMRRVRGLTIRQIGMAHGLTDNEVADLYDEQAAIVEHKQYERGRRDERVAGWPAIGPAVSQ